DAGRRYIRSPEDDSLGGRWGRRPAAVAGRKDRRIVVALPWRGRQVGVWAQHDLVDDCPVFALLHADGMRAIGREVYVRTARSPAVVGPAPSLIARIAGAVLENEFRRTG